MVSCQGSNLWGTHGLLTAPSQLMEYLLKGPHSPTFNCTHDLNIFPTTRMESVKPFQLVFPWQSKARPPSAHSLPTQYSVSLKTNPTLTSWPLDPESHRTLSGHLCTSLLILPSQHHRLILFLKLSWLQGLCILLDLVLWHPNVANATRIGFLLKGMISDHLPKVACLYLNIFSNSTQLWFPLYYLFPLVSKSKKRYSLLPIPG